MNIKNYILPMIIGSTTISMLYAAGQNGDQAAGQQPQPALPAAANPNLQAMNIDAQPVLPPVPLLALGQGIAPHGFPNALIAPAAEPLPPEAEQKEKEREEKHQNDSSQNNKKRKNDDGDDAPHPKRPKGDASDSDNANAGPRAPLPPGEGKEADAKQAVNNNQGPAQNPPPNRNLMRHVLFTQQGLADTGWTKDKPLTIEDLKRLQEMQKKSGDKALLISTDQSQYIEYPYKKPEEISRKAGKDNGEVVIYDDFLSLLDDRRNALLEESHSVYSVLIKYSDQFQQSNQEESRLRQRLANEYTLKETERMQNHKMDDFINLYRKKLEELVQNPTDELKVLLGKTLANANSFMTLTKNLELLSQRIEATEFTHLSIGLWREIYLNRRSIFGEVEKMINLDSFRPFIFNHSSINSERHHTYIHLENGYMMRGNKENRGVFFGGVGNDGTTDYDGVEIEQRLTQYHQAVVQAYKNIQQLNKLDAPQGNPSKWTDIFIDDISQSEDVCADAKSRSLQEFSRSTNEEIERRTTGVVLEAALNNSYMLTYRRQDLPKNDQGNVDQNAFLKSMTEELEKIKIRGDNQPTPEAILKYIEMKNKEILG